MNKTRMITALELRNAAKAAAVQIKEIGDAPGAKSFENPTLIRLVQAISAWDKEYKL